MEKSVIDDPVQKRLLRYASWWRLAGMLFECPADGWHEALAGLVSLAEDTGLQQAVKKAEAEASPALYYSVFGPGGPASPREAAFHNNLNLGGLLAELSGYYSAFAYTPETQEPDDHVSVEAGFIGYLRLKQSYALACGDAGRAEIAADAAGKFMKEHLSPFVESLAAILGRSDIGYLSLAASALSAGHKSH